jgi:hypothetical protein
LARPFKAREISEISVARFSPAAAGRHQLDVVDHDQAELAALAHQPARAGAQFQHIEPRRLVDEDRRVVELAEA